MAIFKDNILITTEREESSGNDDAVLQAILDLHARHSRIRAKERTTHQDTHPVSFVSVEAYGYGNGNHDNHHPRNEAPTAETLQLRLEEVRSCFMQDLNNRAMSCHCMDWKDYMKSAWAASSDISAPSATFFDTVVTEPPSASSWSFLRNKRRPGDGK